MAYVPRSALFALGLCLWLGRKRLLPLGPCSADNHLDKRRGISVSASGFPRWFSMLVWLFSVSLGPMAAWMIWNVGVL